MTSFSNQTSRFTRNLGWASLSLLLVFALPARATGLSPAEIQTPFVVGPMKPDPSRNLVYLVDQTYNRLLAINTDTGIQVAAAPIDDGASAIEITISVDGTKLYLSESAEDEILVFSLPDLTSLPTLPVAFPPQSIASCANGRLFATESSTDGIDNYIVEVSTTDGSIVQKFGSSEGYYYNPLLRTNGTGTNLYAGTTGISGFLDFYVYDVTGAQASAATGYEYDSENMEDFEPDDAKGRIYAMNGGIYGVNVILTASDNDSTVWPFTQPYGVAVSFNSSSSVVFGASYSEVREFNRTTGAPLADWVVVGDDDVYNLVPAGIGATANNNLIYIRAADEAFSPTYSYIGFISTTGVGVTLVPSITDTLSFNPISSGAPGQQVTLQATDLSGLSVTYQVVSGPATISGDVLTYTGMGTVVVSANTPGNLVYKQTTTTQSITVALASQTIGGFPVISNHAYGDAPFSITKPAASSGLFVTVTVKSGPATFNGAQVTVTGVGAVTLAADQGGNSTYSSAPEVTTSFLVNKATQTIASFAPIAAKVVNSKPFAITPPTSSSGLPVTVSVQSGPATISGNTVTLTGSGTVVLAANQVGNTNYLGAATVTTQFTVNGAVQKIAAFKAIAAKTYTLVPFAVTAPTASSGLPVTLTVLSGPATISGNNVTLNGLGTVMLAANQAGNASYAAAPQVTISFTVHTGSQTITPFETIPTQGFGVAPFTITLPTASSGLPVNAFVKSGPATLTGNTVTITGSGTVVLAADQPGNANVSPAKEVTTSFAVKVAQTIEDLGSIASQTFGGAPFTVTPPTASSGLAVALKILSGPATIKGTTITLTGAGTVVLAADQAGNTTFAPALEATTSFSVGQAAQTLAAFKALAEKVYGAAPFTVAAPVATSRLPVVLSVLSGPATISGTKVTLTGAGTVTLAANQPGDVNYAAASQVTTTLTVNKAAQKIGKFARIASQISTGPPFVVPPPVATSHLPVTLSVISGPAMISGDTVTPTGSGTVVLAADQAGDDNYNPAPEVTVSILLK
jgi:hypothetical protein